MIMFPPCKINLGLYVRGKRADGYHELESIMYQLPFCDILEIVPADAFVFNSSGLTIAGNEDSNLCVKAYRIMQEKYGIQAVKMHLHKQIPMGAGLGGGSADGTYTLLLLNKLFRLNLSSDELRILALQLGSDCPLFVESGPQLAKGRGEILQHIALDLRGYYLQLINIGIHISTKEAFSQVRFTSEDPELEKTIQLPVEQWRENLRNDFEESVFSLYPGLEEMKKELYSRGALYVSMTGSGSTIFALFKEKPEAFERNSAKKILDYATIL